MQVVKRSIFGDRERVDYTIYLNPTEYKDIFKMFESILLPYPSPSEDQLELYRLSALELFDEVTLKRLMNILSQMSLQL